MPETVTLVLDAEQYYREIAKVTGATRGLARSGEEIGGGFLRSERAFRGATVNIVRGLATATTAADATLLTMTSLERVFKIPIAATVLAAGGFALLDVIVRTLEKARALREEMHRLRSESTLGADFLGTDQINANLSGVAVKIQEIEKDVAKLRGGFLKFGIVDLMGDVTRANFIKEDEKKLADLRQTAANDVLSLTSKQNDLNRVEMERLDGAEDIADLDKAEIDNKERLGKLGELIKNSQLQETVAAEQLLSVENDRYELAVRTLKVKQQQAQTKSLDKAGDFFADIGSGRFLQVLEEEKKRTQDILRGQQQIAELRDAEARGEELGPNAKAELRVADRLGAKVNTGLNALLNADFSNMLTLSKYDFSGLASLSGLTIQVQ